MNQHTLSVLVENKPGVLVRIAGLFSRRGFNIESLAVGPTEHEEISRMTIVVNCEEHPLEQVTKQLNKLINVIKIVELEPTQAVQRELMLIKVRADTDSRSKVLETVELFRAHVVDVAVDAVTVEATGSHDKLEALVRVLEPFHHGPHAAPARALRLNQHCLRPQVKSEYSRTNSCFASTAMTCSWSQPRPFLSKVSCSRT
jgi:acetolactate synthase I/III small subunit